jgi:hypothetical protein
MKALPSVWVREGDQAGPTKLEVRQRFATAPHAYPFLELL